MFDHTSIIKTILARFCPKALHARQAGAGNAKLHLGPHHPGLRVAQASHLGELLTRSTPRAAPARDALVQQAAARAAQIGTSQSQPVGGEEGEHQLNDLQRSILAATRKLRSDGHPAGAP